MNEKKVFLRVIIKLFTGFAAIWIAYIFLAGFFINDDHNTAESYTFDLSSLTKNNAMYFKTNRRELLVINSPEGYQVFWANDPIYGCRLEYKNSLIIPVCIHIEYDLTGYNKANDQQLLVPDFKINQYGELVVF